jgi:hypothetical protein
VRVHGSHAAHLIRCPRKHRPAPPAKIIIVEKPDIECLTNTPVFFSLFRWSVGSALFLLSWAVLMGPWTYAKHLISGSRLPFTAAYFGSIALTLYFAIGVSLFPFSDRSTSIYYPVLFFPCCKQLRLHPAVGKKKRGSHILLFGLSHVRLEWRLAYRSASQGPRGRGRKGADIADITLYPPCNHGSTPG